MNGNSDKQNEGKKYMTFMENALLGILILGAIIYAIVFGIGQIHANKAILDLEQALQKALVDSEVPLEEYNAATQYMESSQQAYNASTTTNMISIIYGLVTAVILGYGVKMLRFGEEERRKFREMESQLTKLKDEMTTKTKTISQEMQKRFEQQNEIYIATTSCRNAAHICSLIQSYIAFLAGEGQNISEIPNDNIIHNLESDFISSLTNFCESMKEYSEKASDLSDETINALNNSWGLATNSIRTYLDKGDKPSLIQEAFGDDQPTVQELYEKINNYFRQIRKRKRTQE